MSSVSRFVSRTSRLNTLPGVLSSQSRRWAHQSSGNEQSGKQQARMRQTPRRQIGHHGPEAAASESSAKQSTGSSPEKRVDGARPTIHEPKSAAEDSDPEVRKHNEEMRQRADRSVNQLSEEDNKVDKNFWKGDVGDMKGKKE